MNYSGQAVDRALLEAKGTPDDNETEWRQNIDTVMRWYTEEDFDFVTLYYGEPDNVGHAKGPETEERRNIIKMIDRTLGYLRQAIAEHGLTDRLNVIITSDHGMTTMNTKHNSNVTEIVLNKFINFLYDVHFEMVDYGGFGMLNPRKGKKLEVYNKLKNAHPNLSVYLKEELPENFHLANNSRMLDIILVGDLGYNLNSVSIEW